jgi:hypothetical protein
VNTAAAGRHAELQQHNFNKKPEHLVVLGINHREFS